MANLLKIEYVDGSFDQISMESVDRNAGRGTRRDELDALFNRDDVVATGCHRDLETGLVTLGWNERPFLTNVLPTGARFFEVDGVRYKAEARPDPDARFGARARAFVFGPGDDVDAQEILAPLAKLVGASSIHTKRGDYPALDKAWDIVNGEIVARKRKVLDAALRAFHASAGERGARFSRRAGCSCGCSPGFILDGIASRRMDLFVSVVKEQSKAA